MEITIKMQRTQETKKIKLDNNSTIDDLLKKIDIKPDTVIVMHKNKPVPIDNVLKDGQEINILEVSSGG